MDKGCKNIIVIDDERIIRTTLSEYLISLGFYVTVFDDGNKAIEYYRDNDVDLVISDMVMPEISGKSIFYKLKEFDKDLVFILLTGYETKALDEKFKNDITVLLEKPVKLPELKRKIFKIFYSN